MRDPYEILGVPKGATASNIKSAYRRLAKKLHPDANKNDPKSAAQFSELNSAYEILGDEGKRKAFDRGEIDAEGKPRFQGFPGFDGAQRGARDAGGFESFTWGPGFQRGGARTGGAGGGFGGGIDDILKEMMGGARGARARAHFDPDDFVGGAGAVGQDIAAALTVSLADLAKGASRVRLPTGKDLDVKLPAGLTDGQQIRLKGQGLAGPRGAGDVLITVTIARHPVFERDGVNLRLDLPVTLYEAVLGAKVRVPTLDGAVELAIPAGTNSGRTFRLKAKGLPARDGKGDLLATVRVMLPDRSDAELEALMRKWRDQASYDPRKDLG